MCNEVSTSWNLPLCGGVLHITSAVMSQWPTSVGEGFTLGLLPQVVGLHQVGRHCHVFLCHWMDALRDSDSPRWGYGRCITTHAAVGRFAGGLLTATLQQWEGTGVSDVSSTVNSQGCTSNTDIWMHHTVLGIPTVLQKSNPTLNVHKFGEGGVVGSWGWGRFFFFGFFSPLEARALFSRKCLELWCVF